MFILVVIIPIIVGVIATIFFKKKSIKEQPSLLLHKIVKNNKFTFSLSQISSKQFTQICKNLSSKNLRFNSIESKKEGNLALNFDDGDSSIIDIAYPILNKFGFTATLSVPTGHFIGKEIVDVYRVGKLLKREDIIKLSNSGFEIASHTVTHRDLVLLSKEDIEYELRESKEFLEKIIQKEVLGISFPYGSWNREILDMAKELGYKRFYCYGNHNLIKKDESNIYPLFGIYPFDFDNEYDIINKVRSNNRGNSISRAKLIPHFAKGGPLFKWNKSYNIFRLLRSKK